MEDREWKMEEDLVCAGDFLHLPSSILHLRLLRPPPCLRDSVVKLLPNSEEWTRMRLCRHPRRIAVILTLAAFALVPLAARAQEPAKKPAAPAPPKDVNFEKEIAAYEAADLKSPPPAGGIEFI